MKKGLLFFGLVLAIIASSIPAMANKVYFNNPANWATVKAYFFVDGGSPHSGWPGTVTMTKAAGETLWSCDVPASFENAKFIANNDNNGAQFPAVGGLDLGNKSMFLQLDNDMKTYIWTEYQTAAFTVYFDNDFANWDKVFVHYWGATGSEWADCPEMTKVAGTNVYKATVPAGTAGVLFKNAKGDVNADGQTANFTALPGHKYSKTGDTGAYTEPVDIATPFTVYFDNLTTGWATPTIHYWGGDTESTYPGVAMTAVTGQTQIYSATVPAHTSGLLFNGGGTPQEADATKTGNFTAQKDHIYTQSADKGEYADYTREVEMPAKLYIMTNNGTEPMSPGKATEMTKSGNTFTVSDIKIEEYSPGKGSGYFTFVTKTGADWDDLNSGDRYGATEEDATLTDGKAAFVKVPAPAGSAKSWVLAQGTYSFVVNFETMEVTVSGNAIVAGSGKIDIPGVEVAAGASGKIDVQIDTESNIVGMQLDIALPSCAIAAAPTIAPALQSTHQIQGNTVNGKYRILIKSDNNTAFPVKKGTIFSLPFSVVSSAEAGEYPITVENIVLSDENRLKATLQEGTIGKIKVTAAAVSTIKLNKTELALKVPGSETLVATDEDDNALTGVIWSSSNTAVATVTQSGLVTAVANGLAVITATHGTAKATCNVTVGKDAQTIVWETAYANEYKVGDEITLDATSTTATAETPIVYTIISGASYATLSGNVLTAIAPGTVTVQASLAAHGTYAPANPVTKTISIGLGYKPGDVNGDNTYDITDATMTINLILGKNPEGFNATAADLNGDGEIDIVDVTLIIDLVLEATTPAPAPAPARVAALLDQYYEQFSISSANNTTLNVSFSNMFKYCATQFDITIPEGCALTGAMMSNGSATHIVSYNQIGDNKYRVVAYSKKNFNFKQDGTINLYFDENVDGQVVISSAIINEVDGDNIIASIALGTSAEISGIENIVLDNNTNCQVYSIDGMCIYNGTVDGFRAQGNKGIYLIKTEGKTHKVLVR